MEHILLVHLFEAEDGFVYDILAEVFTVPPEAAPYHVRQRAAVHELQDQVGRTLALEKIDAPDELIAVNKRDETCLVDQVLPILVAHIPQPLHREHFLVKLASDLVYFGLAAYIQLLADHVLLSQTVKLQRQRFLHQVVNLRVRSQPLLVIVLLCKCQVQVDAGQSAQRLEVPLDVHLDGSGDRTVPLHLPGLPVNDHFKLNILIGVVEVPQHEFVFLGVGLVDPSLVL